MNEQENANVRMAIEILKLPEMPKIDTWDMNHWGQKEAKCGTSACFAGAMSLQPYFIAQGYEGIFVEPEDEFDRQQGDLHLKLSNGKVWEDGVADLFGISYKESMELCMPEYCSLDAPELDDALQEYFNSRKGEDPMTREVIINRLENLLLRYS